MNLKTNVYKSIHNGWTAESMTEADANGKAWQITTNKGRNGAVSCSAIEGNLNERGIFSYEMFGAKRLQLASITGQCTEKKVQEVHAAGLVEFSKVMADTKPATPVYVVGVGQVIFTDHIMMSTEESRRVIYEVKSPGSFKTVSLDGKKLTHDEHVKPYSEKYGIGVYYNEGDTIPQDEVLQLVEKAKKHLAEEAAKAEIEAEEAAKVKAEKIAKGREILPAIPAGVVNIIVAECREDESDLQSDYHGYSTTETVYLSYSTHTRDLFPEMRKAGGKFEGTKHFETAEEKPADADKWWTPKDEHREKYSMGSGYYLGNKYSGWIVAKRSIDIESATMLEKLQIAAAEGRFFCHEADINKQTETSTAPAETAPKTPGKIQFVDYSEKAFVVIGDTKPIKEKLKELGGSFNFRLTCGAGWIFSKKKLEEVKKALSAPKQQEQPQEPEPTTLRDEIKKTVEFLADTDRKLYGEVTEGTKEAASFEQMEAFASQLAAF